MYKNLAFLNGILLAIMVFFNGRLSGLLGPYLATLIFHFLGLIIIIMIAFVKKNHFPCLRTQPLLFFLPGVLSVVTILLNNITIPRIGLSLVTGIALFGQLVMSSLVEHYGLFSRRANPIRREKVFGLGIITAGIIVMILL